MYRTKAMMKLREQISIVCHVILFKPKSFHLSHWGFQGQPQLLNCTSSAPLKYTQPDLPFSLSPGKYSENSFWMNLFLNPTLHCWNNLETRRNIIADSITLSGHEPVPTAEQRKKAAPDIKFEKQAPKIKAILPNTVNHSTRKNQAKNCSWGMPPTAYSQIT